MKKQIVVIGGGNTFKNYKEFISSLKNTKFEFNKPGVKRWKETLSEKLGNKFEVLNIRMPNTANAKYKEWKIVFDKVPPFLKNKIIFVGHSLGGIFLAKYLSQDYFPKKISGLFLVAAPFERKNAKYNLANFKLPRKLSNLEKQCKNIFLYHSKDDNIIPFTDLGKYKKVLPNAKAAIFTNRGHFIDQTSFPELIKDIKILN